jgi:hypothetical protein
VTWLRLRVRGGFDWGVSEGMDIPIGFGAHPEATKFSAVIGLLKQFDNLGATERKKARSVRARDDSIVATLRDLLTVARSHMRTSKAFRPADGQAGAPIASAVRSHSGDCSDAG